MAGINVFVQELATGSIDRSPDRASSQLVVEDNVGESIHVHFRNIRLEMSIEDFRRFASEIEAAGDQLKNGNN